MIDIQKTIQSKSSQKVNNTFFIAVDGHGGSGKTTLARLLSEKLQAEVIHTDDFASWDNPLNWWKTLLEKVFKPIENGANTLSYDRAKFWPDHEPEPVVNQPITPIMLLEGVSSSRKEFEKYIGFSIFVDTPSDLSKERGVQRDLSSNLKHTEEEIRKNWKNWQQEEKAFFTKNKIKENVDLIIDGSKPFEEQIIL